MCREIASAWFMEGKLMEEILNFLSEWAGWIFGFFAAAFAVRGSLNLSIHELKKENNRKLEQNLKALCPHVICQKADDGSLIFAKYFFKQPKSRNTVTFYKCELCGYKTINSNHPYGWLKYWRDNPKAWQERSRKIEELAAKLGR